MFQPRAKDEIEAYVNAKVAKCGFYDTIIAPNAAKLSNPSGAFRYLFIGRSKVNFNPDSLMNAAIEPVNVTPPINVPR